MAPSRFWPHSFPWMRLCSHTEDTNAPITSRCRPKDSAKGTPNGARLSYRSSRSMGILLLFMARRAGERLGHDRDIRNASLLHCVHHGRKGAERNSFIGAEIDDLLRGIDVRIVQPRRNIVDIDGVIAQKYTLIAVNGDDLVLLRGFAHRARFRHSNIDA